MATHEELEILQTRWFEELWNKKNYSVVQKLVHADYLDHGDGTGESKIGPQGAAEIVKSWHAAFPDGRMTLEDISSEGDMTAVRVTFRGTHSGQLGDIPPSGKKVVVTSVRMDRIVDGKFKESWGDFNRLGVMQQIGAVGELN